MDGIDWEAVERIVRPLYIQDQFIDWDTAKRMARQAAYLCLELDGVDADRARLLCWFAGLRTAAADPAARRQWLRPLRDAGVGLPLQTWLWIALDRYAEAPATDEERVVHDARGLEQVGALGIAHAFARGGRQGQTLRDVTLEIRNAIAGVVFLTPSARRLGVRRIVYTRRFLKELEED